MSLSLRNQVRIASGTVAVLWLLLHALFVGVWSFLENWEVVTLAMAVVLGFGVAGLLARRAVSRYTAALTGEDLPTARHEYEMLRDFWRGRGSEIVKSYGINLLMLEGRYREALEQLQALDMKRIGEKSAPVIASNIAWCLAQSGEPEKALERIQLLLPQLESMGPDAASSDHLVAGVAHFLQGWQDKAVTHLGKARTTDSPSRKSAVLFYLGEVHTALGNAEEAKLAYQQAYETLPNGKFGVKALDRIERVSVS